MKVWAFIHPTLKTLCCALIQTAIPSGVDAVEFDVDTVDDIVLDNGVIRLKTDAEKLQEIKKKTIDELYEKAYDYVFRFYNDKQLRSDVISKELGENFFAYKDIDLNSFRKDVYSLISSNIDYQSSLTNLNQKYNSNNDTTILFWISELLKIAYRHYFAFRVSQELVSYIQQIQQATTLPLPTFDFKTQFPNLS